MVSPLEIASEYAPRIYNAVQIGGIDLDYIDCAFLFVGGVGLSLFAYVYIKYIIKDAIEEARRAKEELKLEEDKYLGSDCLEDTLTPPRIF